MFESTSAPYAGNCNLAAAHLFDRASTPLITRGVKGEMRSFAKKLNDSDIQALTAYLRALPS